MGFLGVIVCSATILAHVWTPSVNGAVSSSRSSLYDELKQVKVDLEKGGQHNRKLSLDLSEVKSMLEQNLDLKTLHKIVEESKNLIQKIQSVSKKSSLKKSRDTKKSKKSISKAKSLKSTKKDVKISGSNKPKKIKSLKTSKKSSSVQKTRKPKQLSRKSTSRKILKKSDDTKTGQRYEEKKPFTNQKSNQKSENKLKSAIKNDKQNNRAPNKNLDLHKQKSASSNKKTSTKKVDGQHTLDDSEEMMMEKAFESKDRRAGTSTRSSRRSAFRNNNWQQFLSRRRTNTQYGDCDCGEASLYEKMKCCQNRRLCCSK